MQGLAEQLYSELRERILAGTLEPGARLPSTRRMAADRGLARNTVIDAFDRLAGEGYIESRTGSGSFVASTLPEARLHALPPQIAAKRPPQSARAALSQRAEAVLGEVAIMEGEGFPPCVPDLSHFPFKEWQSAVSRAWRNLRQGEAAYGGPGGHIELRTAIAHHLQLSRQVRCTPAQVVVTNGAQHGLDLCARLLADAGDTALVEDPGYPGARRMFRAANLELAPVPLDEEGVAPTARHWRRRPKLVYITPSHQFPSGVVMSLSRRRALLDAAAAHGAWIIEDDYDGEFRFSGRPIASLQGIDRDQRVIYLGTFSKALFPGLRLGYLVLPEPIAPRFALAAAQLAFEGRLVTQGVLANFMRSGQFAAHVRRMRLVYEARRDLFVRTWRRELGDAAPLSGMDTGMHLLVELPAGIDRQVSEAAAAQGIAAQSLSSFYLGPPTRHGLVIGYGGVHEQAIRRHAHTLAQLVRGALRIPG
jgi:GntR family transcriptional regulator/MocR family aminotransferase